MMLTGEMRSLRVREGTTRAQSCPASQEQSGSFATGSLVPHPCISLPRLSFLFKGAVCLSVPAVPPGLLAPCKSPKVAWPLTSLQRAVSPEPDQLGSACPNYEGQPGGEVWTCAFRAGGRPPPPPPLQSRAAVSCPRCVTAKLTTV